MARYSERTLISTVNTTTIDRRIRSAARKRFHYRTGIQTFFEHGQWWLVINRPNFSRSYSVVDAEGPGSIDGFDFELIEEEEY